MNEKIDIWLVGNTGLRNPNRIQDGFKVFAVHTQNDKEKWENFVTEHELFDFINCWDPQNQTNFRVYYHIDSTPVMYLLDKDKKIIAKKLDIEQFADILTKEYKRIGIEVKN